MFQKIMTGSTRRAGVFFATGLSPLILGWLGLVTTQ